MDGWRGWRGAEEVVIVVVEAGVCVGGGGPDGGHLNCGIARVVEIGGRFVKGENRRVSPQ